MRSTLHLMLLLHLIWNINANGQSYALNTNLPQHSDTVQTLRPLFAWNCVGLNERCNFTIKVCKVNESQSPYDALQMNIPIIQAGPVSNTTLNYPAFNNDLDSASMFVWQVTMYDTGIPVAMSDVAHFYTPYPKDQNNTFWFLNELSQRKLIEGRKLTFIYENRLMANSIKVNLTRNKDSQVVFSNELTLQAGLNYFDLSKLNNFPFLDPDSYFVSIIVSQNEQFEFTYIQQ